MCVLQGVGLLLAEVLLRFGAAVPGRPHAVGQPSERQFLICDTHTPAELLAVRGHASSLNCPVMFQRDPS